LLKLTAPRVHAANAYYYRKFGLDERVFRRTNAAFVKALRGGRQLTRKELAEILERARIDASGVRLAYIVIRAELEAVICSGGLRGKQFTYALLDERVPPTKELEREEALAELTRRYFTSHGPALLQDFAWWSGLTVSDAKIGVEMNGAGLTSETLDGKTFWFAPGEPGKKRIPTILLLPNYDEYGVAYKDRSLFYDRSLVQNGQNDDAVTAHIIMRRGEVAGGWRRSIAKGEVSIKTDLLVEFDRSDREALKAACERYGKF